MDFRHFVRVTGPMLGTGYRVRPDRILTASHVVWDAEVVQVEFDRAGGTLARVDARVLWQGDESLDAALLECEPADDLPAAFTYLATGPLTRSDRWESYGCAKAADDGLSVADCMVLLGGTIGQGAEHQERVELVVEGRPEEIRHWGGVSGAPIFVKGQIHGVLREAARDFKGRRLHATPAHRLMADEDFVAALGLERGPEWEVLLDRARDLLAGDREAAEAVAREHGGWREVFSAGGAVELAKEVCGRGRIEDVLMVMHRAHSSLLRSQRRRAARTLEHLLEILVPLLYARGLVHHLKTAGGAAELRIPVATATIAEVAMAAADTRPYRFRPVEIAKSFPEPVASVAGPVAGRIPEPGIDFGGERAFKDFTDHLARAFVHDEDRQMLRRRPEEEQYRDLSRLVTDELEWLAGEHVEGVRRYFLYTRQFALEHASLLAQVRKEIPSLHLLELTGDDLVGERRLCRPLRDLLYRAQNLDGEGLESSW